MFTVTFEGQVSKFDGLDAAIEFALIVWEWFDCTTGSIVVSREKK